VRTLRDSPRLELVQRSPPGRAIGTEAIEKRLQLIGGNLPLVRHSIHGRASSLSEPVEPPYTDAPLFVDSPPRQWDRCRVQRLKCPRGAVARRGRRAPPSSREGRMQMEQHGSESYFVLGEGLLGESGEGRPRTLAAAVEANAPPFRFGRVLPLSEISDARGACARVGGHVSWKNLGGIPDGHVGSGHT
jgi:hypothetical protein